MTRTILIRVPDHIADSEKKFIAYQGRIGVTEDPYELYGMEKDLSYAVKTTKTFVKSLQKQAAKHTKDQEYQEAVAEYITSYEELVSGYEAFILRIEEKFKTVMAAMHDGASVKNGRRLTPELKRLSKSFRQFKINHNNAEKYKEYQKEYRQKNKKVILDYKMNRKPAQSQKTKTLGKQINRPPVIIKLEETPEEKLERRREYQREYQREYRKAHREQIREYRKAWYQEHKVLKNRLAED